MRAAMRESTSQIVMPKRLQEEKEKRLSEHRIRGDQLFEKWSNKKNLGEGLDRIYDKSPDKGRNLAIVLENQMGFLKQLTETQVSNAFQTTPENVLRVIRLGYPNSVRSELFFEWAMETARDSIYYLAPIYGSTKRGATYGDKLYESPAYRFASEIEIETVGTGNGSTTNFTYSLANLPARPFTITIIAGGVPVATDNGAGSLIGDALNLSLANTINYVSGALVLNFTVAPVSGAVIEVQYNFDSEVDTNFPDIGDVQLTLKAYQFKCFPWPLGVSWTKMTELLLGTTLNIDAEEALIRGAGDEFKKSLDFHALTMGYRYAKGNAFEEFDADFASAGADSEIAHAQSFTRAIDNAGDRIFEALQRGGVTYMFGGTRAVNYVKLHLRFKDTGKQPKIGAHRVGELDGVGIYKVPNTICPSNELVCIWKNEQVPEDVSLAFGSLIPLYQTQTLEFKQAYKETGLFHFGDAKALNPKYLVRIVLKNLPL